MEDLKKFISDCDHSDIESSGFFYTWCNKSSLPENRIWCKLDRVIGNSEWFDQFPESSVVYLPPTMSDHSPVVVCWSSRPVRKAAFRYCNFWENLEEYADKVTNYWRSSRDCNNLFMVQDKLKAMKRMMKNEFVNVTRGMDRRVDLLRENLCEAQKLAEQHPTNSTMLQREQELAKEFRKVKRYQHIFYQQRAKVKWLREGDTNTKYYHSILKGRRARNNIKSVLCNNRIMTSDHISEYFKSILAETKECNRIKAKVINRGNKVADSQCRSLIREATNKEIQNVLCKIEVDKSPGPDGFSASFFRKNWSLVGKEFCNGIRHCLKYNALPKGVNTAYTAWIPKTNLAIHPSDFRPISCCNVVYKVLSGFLAGRLKGILPDIIDVAQGAFIQGRSIIGNVCMAPQLLSGYNRKSISERMAWKIDLRKAYDTVDWSFLRSMLVNLNFPMKFISWISMCVESTCFSIQINGELVDFLMGSRACAKAIPSPLCCLLLLWNIFLVC
ncbi:hypothetical protein QQ045_007895 [Rhodiola kirilowii]